MGPMGCAAGQRWESVKVRLNGGKWCEMRILGMNRLYLCGVLLRRYASRGVPLARTLYMYF